MAIPFFRTGKIRIKPSATSEWMEFKDIDFKFDIDKPIGSVCMEAKISILGLSWEHILAISTWTAEDYALAKEIRIQAFAGYGEDGYKNCIFDGNILYAMPTMPPNIWLNIIAITGSWRSNKVFDKDFGLENSTPVPFRKYLHTLSEFIGDKTPDMTNLNIPDVPENLPYYKAGSTYQEVFDDIVSACEKHGAIMWEEVNEDGSSHFVFEDAVVDEEYLKNKNVFNDAKKLHTISAENGMVGIPRVEFAEIEVTKFLDTTMNRCGFFYLDTKYAPDDKWDSTLGTQNGFYRINNIRHHGHLRGNEWFTTLKAWRWQNNDASNDLTELKKFGV